jgi:putative ABC transport system ATP-binding protein
MTGEVMIELKDIRKEYRTGGETSVILDDCTLEIPDGSFVAVLGPSGSGKTTLLNLIGGLDTATSGSVSVEGINLDGLDRWSLTEMRRRTVGFIFQFYNLIPTLTARENVLCALELLAVPTADARRRTDEMLAAVGLDGKEDLFPAQLSGGQQQRVAIARALVKRPPLVLADEPTGNLDRKLGAQIMGLLVTLREETGTTLVVVTHDPSVARRADLVVRLDEGRLEVGSGAAAQLGGAVS